VDAGERKENKRQPERSDEKEEPKEKEKRERAFSYRVGEGGGRPRIRACKRMDQIKKRKGAE